MTDQKSQMIIDPESVIDVQQANFFTFYVGNNDLVKSALNIYTVKNISSVGTNYAVVVADENQEIWAYNYFDNDFDAKTAAELIKDTLQIVNNTDLRPKYVPKFGQFGNNESQNEDAEKKSTILKAKEILTEKERIEQDIRDLESEKQNIEGLLSGLKKAYDESQAAIRAIADDEWKKNFS